MSSTSLAKTCSKAVAMVSSRSWQISGSSNAAVVPRSLSTASMARTPSEDSFLPPINAAQVQLQGESYEQHRPDRDAEELRRILRENAQVRNDFAYCLSLADDSEFNRNFINTFTDASMMEQLRISDNQLRPKQQQRSASTTTTTATATADKSTLPRTLQDALRPTRRAIVITEATAPFRIVEVNRAWETLCGYSFREAKGKTLGSLLHGPETNTLAATSLIAQLLRGEQAGTTLINYTKDKKRFCNRIQVGPIVDENDNDKNVVKYFVGVLQEVKEMNQNNM